MKVFVAGATGVLGRRTVRDLVARGHAVTALARKPENEAPIRALGAEPQRADLLDADSLVRAAGGADVVVRAATAIPPGVRWRASDWATNDRIRRDGTRALSACAGRIHAKLYVQEGIVWVATPADGSSFDETSPVRPRLWYGSAIDSERIAREAGAAGGFEVATLRFGGFYSADSAQTRFMGERLVRRRLPIVGRGDAVWSNIHLDDAAAAMVAAVEGMRSGLWHVVDDHPTTTADFFRTFARLLNAPGPRSIPAWIARLFVGGAATAFLTSSTRTSNAKISRDLGWRPKYPTHLEGLNEIVAAWRGEGFLAGDLASDGPLRG